MTPLQIVVLIAFLLILGGAAAYILFTGRNRMKNDPTRKEQFDERQKSARGFACFAALGSLAGCETVALLVWALFSLPEGVLALGTMFSIGLGFLVFVCVAIWKHAFLRMSEKPGAVIGGCAALLALGGGMLILYAASGSYTASGVLQSVEGIIAALVVLAVQLVRIRLDKREEQSEEEA